MKKNKTDIIPPRFKWALEILQPKPAGRIVEIGCGTGMLTSLIAAQLTTGEISAIDRSASMIRTAKKRNSAFIANGQAAIIETSLEEWNSSRKFDAVVAFNVSMFWKEPKQALPLVKRLLKTNGRFFAFYQPPGNTTEIDMQAIQLVFESNGLLIEDILIKKMKPFPTGCFITTFIKTTVT